jgi:glycosyltransferase involved in cell wall biosynthesis
VTFGSFCEEVRRVASSHGIERIHLTDTSPHRIRTSPSIGFRDAVRGVRIMSALLATPVHSRALVFFVTEGLFFRSSVVLRALRCIGIPVVLKFIGNCLDRALQDLPVNRRSWAIGTLNAMTAVLCQTRGLSEAMRAMGVERVHYSPGFRSFQGRQLPSLRETTEIVKGGLRLVHLGLVSEDKGVFRVMEALRAVAADKVTFDIFGEVDPRDRSRLESEIARTPGCRYGGVYEGDTAVLLAKYDVLVLHSSHRGEGHAGAVIEAMAAGIPAIVSDQEGLPELVAHGESGLVVPRGDVAALGEAFRRLAESSALRAKMGAKHRESLGRHDVRTAVTEILSLLGESAP